MIDNNYLKKSNCFIWQGTISLKEGNDSGACKYFVKAREYASTENELEEAKKILEFNCGQRNNNR